MLYVCEHCYFQNGAFQYDNRYSPLKPLKSLAEFNSRVCMSVCVTLCVFVWEVRVSVAWGIQSGGVGSSIGFNRLLPHYILPLQNNFFL
jgi:hypothetical protein